MKFFKDTNTKPFAIAIAVCLLLLVGFSIWFSFLPSQNHLYAKSAQVVSLDYENDRIIEIQLSKETKKQMLWILRF